MNCVCPPMVAWIIICFPFRVRCTLSHRFSFFFMMSSISSQGVRLFILLPIQVPSILMASLSQAILMFRGRVLLSCGLNFLVFTMEFLWDAFPIGMISVFSMLNLTPETLHHLSRTHCI